MAGTGRIGCTSGGALSELTGPRPDEITPEEPKEHSGRPATPSDIGSATDPKLPNRNLDVGHVDFAPLAALDFLGRGCLEEQGQRFFEVLPGFGDGISLAGDIYLRAQSHIPVSLTFHDRGQLSSHPKISFLSEKVGGLPGTPQLFFQVLMRSIVTLDGFAGRVNVISRARPKVRKPA